MNYEHKGIPITFNPASARFNAIINGKNAFAPSLDAMKLKIDKAEKFAPFTVLVEETIPAYKKDKAEAIKAIALVTVVDESNISHHLVRRTVIQIEHDRKAYRSHFLLDSDEHRNCVIKDEPGAIAAWTKHKSLAREFETMKKAMYEKVEAADKDVPYLRAYEVDAK